MAPSDYISTSKYRNHLPDLTAPRFVAIQKQDAWEYAKEFQETKRPPWLHSLWQHWLELLEEPFKGVTSDGVVQRDLYSVLDEKIPIDDIVAAAETLFQSLDESQRQNIMFHIDSPQWRTWSNPEFLFNDKGIRLDSVNDTVRENTLVVLRASLSPEGYEKAVSVMRINGFLGRLVGAPAICNEFSYNMAFFGPYEGTTILQNEQAIGLQLMQSLPLEQQSRARTYETMHDPKMPLGRWNPDDQRHLCGAYRDNRVVPYEGVLVAEMDNENQSLVKEILAEYLLYLPSEARAIRLAHLESFFNTTYFSWIGGFEDHDAFYYRIQSPVVIVEFDHHSGVFLTNEDPAPFHVHTLLRTPNAGDYGRALMPLIPQEERVFAWRGEARRRAHEQVYFTGQTKRVQDRDE